MLDAPNHELRGLYQEASRLQAHPGEIARVVARAGAPRRRHRRGMIAASFAFAALSVAFVLPGPRDALDSFFNGGPTPGAVIDAGSLPDWLQNTAVLPSAGSRAAAGSGRLLAVNDGQQLIAYRDANTARACFAFAHDSDACSDTSVWRDQFANQAVLKLASGVGPTPDGRIAVFGLARSTVTRVELRDGTTTVARADVSNGGWVLVASQKTHDTLVALDAHGTIIQTIDARSWTWTPCTRPTGCH
jgi:hypothetical protein